MSKAKWTREYFENLQREMLGGDGSGGTRGENRRRARILEAATELFMRQGYRKTSVDEIARRAEVAKGTVYLHFDNKAALLMHAIAAEKQVLFERLKPVMDGTLKDDARLHYYVRSLLTVGRDLPLTARLMSGDNEVMVALDEWDPDLLEKGQRVGEEWLMWLIEDAAPYEFDDANRRERANVLLTLRWFVTMLLEPRYRGGRTLDELADTMTDVLVYGLVHRPPGQRDRLEQEPTGDEDEETA